MRTRASYQLSSLVGNVASGFKLGLFLPVSRADFHIGAGPFALLAAFNVVVWVAAGTALHGFEGSFNPGAMPAMLAGITMLLLASLLLSRLLRDDGLLPAFAVLLASTDTLFELAGSLILLALDREWLPPLPLLRLGLYVVYVAWAAASSVRAQVILVPWRSPGSRPAALLLIAVVLAFAYVPRDEPWVVDEEDDEPPAEILREDFYHLQGTLLERDLSRLSLQRPGVEDIYFLGVAPYSLQDTFARELGTVKQLMDDRFDTRGRSLSLVNHPTSVATLPIATSTSLRTALARIGETMNVEEDVLFLFLTTHGSASHELAFAWPPLQLQQVNPTLLARMLADSGIKWKVIVLSACYSGGFIEALRDRNTLVITASDATHTSFGCETTSEFTWFSRAFFDEALREQANRGRFSIEEAFARARDSVSAREKASGYEPSNPQMAVGEAMQEKLKSLQGRLAQTRSVAPPVQAMAPAQAPR